MNRENCKPIFVSTIKVDATRNSCLSVRCLKRRQHSLLQCSRLPRDLQHLVYQRLHIGLLQRNPMRTIPLNQSRSIGVAVLVEQLAVQIQAWVAQTVNVDGGQAQDVAPAHHLHEVGAAGKSDLGGVAQHGRLEDLGVEVDDGRAPGHQHGELEVGAGLRGPELRGAHLLAEQQARGHLGALAEAQQADERAGGAGAVVVVHGLPQRRVDVGDGLLILELRVVRQPPQPPLEGAVLRVHRQHVRAG